MTPVSVFVLVLAGLFAVGCTAPTAALFNALIDPATAPAPPSNTAASTEAGQPTAGGQVWWPHPDGYGMTLPAGWSGAVTNRAQTDRLIDAVDVVYPGLGERIVAVLSATRSRVSAVAVDLESDEAIPPFLVVLAQPTEGRRSHGVKTRVYEQVASLPGLLGIPAQFDERLPAGSGFRFVYTLVDPDLGTLRVYSYLFRFGSQAYVVNFVASQDAFDDDTEAVFEGIAESLRFGV